MAQVPFITGAPRTRLRPISTGSSQVTPPASAFGANTGRMFQQAGQVIGQIADQQFREQVQRDERDDAQAVFQAQTTLRTEYLNWSADQRQARRGMMARDLTADFEKFYDERAGELAAQMTSPRQQLLFQQASDRIRLNGLQATRRFEDAELDRAHDVAWETNKISLARVAVDDPEPGNVAATAQAVKQANAYQAARKGLPAEWVQAQNAKDLTQMHSQIVAGMIDSDPKAARRHYLQHADDIDPAARVRIERVLKDATDLVQTQEWADEIMASGLSRADAMAQIEKDHSGEAERDLKREVNTRFNARDAATEERRQEAYGQAAELAVNGQMPPNSLMSQLTGVQRAQVIRARRAELERRKRLAKGETIKTDLKLYGQLRQMANADPAKFMRTDLNQYVDRLAGKEFEALLDRQDAVTKESRKEAKPDKPVATWDRQVRQRVGQMQLKDEDRAEFEIAADDARRDAELVKGSVLTEAEQVQLLDRLLVEGEVSGGGLFGFFDSNATFYQVRDTEQASQFVPEVPDAEREKIEAALQRAGKPVTDEAVQALYRRKVGL